MATTLTEKLIRHAKRRKGILVPLLEDLMTKPLEIVSPEDVKFISNLCLKTAARESVRESDNVFSPSALATCIRHVFLLKNHRSLNIPALKPVRLEPNYYFLTGNFLHLKWQFALFKLAQNFPEGSMFRLVDCEVRILSKRKDHGGTVDAIVEIDGELYIVDFKGINVRAFSNAAAGNTPISYALQLTDYMVLWNSQQGNPRIEKALLISENKGGPDTKHPIALHETVIRMEDYHDLVKLRLRELRKHGENNSIPYPECQSTKSLQFQGCPFRKFCREEVRQVERRNAQSEDTTKLQIATPSRRGRNRARGNSGRR